MWYVIITIAFILLQALEDAARLKNWRFGIKNYSIETSKIIENIRIALLLCVFAVITDHWSLFILYVALRFLLFDYAFNIFRGEKLTYTGNNKSFYDDFKRQLNSNALALIVTHIVALSLVFWCVKWWL